MNITVFDTYDELSAEAAGLVMDAVERKPDLLLCAATGGSPVGLYQRMGERPELFSDIRIIKLDEWGGLPNDHPATCESYLHEHLLNPLAVSPERYIGLRSSSPDPGLECRRVGEWLADHGPIDVCILGLGVNGHLGLNEPADELELEVHVAELTDASRAHAMLTDVESVSHGMTLGIGNIMQSKTIILVVNGTGKRDVFAALLEKRICTHLPASMLWLHHNVHCLCDREVWEQRL